MHSTSIAFGARQGVCLLLNGLQWYGIVVSLGMAMPYISEVMCVCVTSVPLRTFLRHICERL